MVVLDVKDYGPENNRNNRYVLVLFGNFSKIGWTTPLKKKNVQTLKDSFESKTTNSRRKTNLIDTDRGKDFYDNIFHTFLNNKNNKHYSRKTSCIVTSCFCTTLAIKAEEIFFKRLFLKKMTVNGLIYYPQ